MSSGGSNLAADSPDLLALIEQRRAQIAADNGVDPAQVPPDAVTASGSGLDPDISPAYALLQVNRVAAARGLTADQVQDLVNTHIQGRTLGFIGEERVNVLELNLALQQLGARRRRRVSTVTVDRTTPPPAPRAGRPGAGCGSIWARPRGSARPSTCSAKAAAGPAAAPTW